MWHIVIRRMRLPVIRHHRNRGRRSGGGGTPGSVRASRMISHENRIIQILLENGFCIIIMNATAPEGTPPRRINDGNELKLPCPAVPRRGPEAGGPRKIMDFHCSGANSRSCLFLQSTFFLKAIRWEDANSRCGHVSFSPLPYGDWVETRSPIMSRQSPTPSAPKKIPRYPIENSRRNCPNRRSGKKSKIHVDTRQEFS